MIRGEKILVTGASGEVALPLIRFLSTENEVWGVARLADPAARKSVEGAGAKAIAVNIAEGDLDVVPDDVSYVLHLAYFRGGGGDFDAAVKINGEGTGRILQHCRNAKAALVMSASSIYAPVEDPWRLPKEEDAIGGANPPWAPTSCVSKVAQEAVARFCAQAFALPVTIARLNTVYGDSGRFLPVAHMDAVVQGREVVVRWDPTTHTPIHTEEMCDQLEAMLDAASTAATIVNWGGDEIVTVQDWCRLAGTFSGIEPKLRTQLAPNATRSSGADQTKRRSITGPSKVVFGDAYRRIFEARHGAA